MKTFFFPFQNHNRYIFLGIIIYTVSVGSAFVISSHDNFRSNVSFLQKLSIFHQRKKSQFHKWTASHWSQDHLLFISFWGSSSFYGQNVLWCSINRDLFSDSGLAFFKCKSMDGKLYLKSLHLIPVLFILHLVQFHIIH